MKEIHRSDSEQRHHYPIDKKSFIEINPILLYSGKLNKMQGWRDTEHSHKFLEIVFVLEGNGSIFVQGKEYNVTQGDILIYNANVMHYEQSSTEAPLEVSFIAFDNIQLQSLPENHILPMDAEFVVNANGSGAIIAELFDIINDEISRKDAFYIEIAKNTSRALLMYVFRILSQTHGTVELLSKDNVLNEILRYIDRRFLDNLSLEQIADDCFINKFYLAHLFNDQVGMSVGQYIRNKKIELAKGYLTSTKLPISAIAEKCGFSDINYFTRLFKKATELTPLKYRKAFFK